MKGSDRAAFDTHHNYADCLASAMSGETLRCNRSLTKISLPLVGSKDNLVALTKRSLTDEREIVEKDATYSFASTLWLPVKGYYLLFNLLLTIDYILDPRPNAFTMSHAKCMRAFTRRLKDGDIEFTNSTLNAVFDRTIFTTKDESGANLSRRIGLDRRYRIAMAKAADYKLEEWKRQNRIENFRSKESKSQRAEFERTFSISVFEFPYYMRLRANYRDFVFIEGISSGDTANYFESYCDFIFSFANALESLKKEILRRRT